MAVLFATTAFAGETWDGNGGDNDWSTANNWTPNGAPSNDGTANIVMAGTNRLTPRVDVDWDVSSLVFSNTAGGFSISGGQRRVAGHRRAWASATRTRRLKSCCCRST